LVVISGVVQKVTFLGNTDNVTFEWFSYDSTDGQLKKCYPILNHAPKPTKQPMKQQETIKSIRPSVSLPPDLHDTLERMANGKKVSVAWVIRDAAERYIADQWPLFAANGQGATK